MSNGSVIVVSELQADIAVGHIEGSVQVYAYDARSGETHVPSYRTVAYLGPEMVVGDAGVD